MSTPRTIVYVSNAGSGTISVLHLEESDGALQPIQTLELGGMVMPLALSPDRRFLYAARRSEPLAVVTCSIDPESGELTRLGEAPLPASMAYVSTDRTGRFLFSASYPGNVVAVGPISADGVAQAVQATLPTAPHAHAIAADPTNRFVFATALGGDHVMQWRFDASTGHLTPNDPPLLQTRAGAGPRHFVFHPNGHTVYLLNELDASLDVLAFDATTGTLSVQRSLGTLPRGFAGEPWASDLHLTPDARFLYTSERRSSTLAGFAVDASSGDLTAIGHFQTQAQPRGFAIDPSGRYLLAAGQLSDAIGVHAIDAHSGALALRHVVAVGSDPNWIEVLRLH